MKKALALILSLMMIMSVCSVSAAFVDNVGATEGVILSDDFESYASIADTRRANGGPYNSTGGAWPMTIDGNKVWATQVSDGNQTLWYANNRTGAAAISSGKLIISMDVMVVGGYEGTKLYNDSVYPSIYVTLWTTTGNTQFCVGNTSDEDAAKGGIVSFKNGGYGVTTSDANVAYFSADEFHTIKEVIDYKAGKTYFYLDEALVYTANSATPWITGTGEFGFLNNGGTTNVNFPADANGVKPYVCVDNISLEAVKDYSDVPSSELNAPIVIESADFSSEDDALKFVLAADGVTPKFWGSSTIADGVLTLSKEAYPLFNLPANNLTDIYELSYDVYGQGGRLVVYDYSKGAGSCSANLGCYKPGSGFVVGQSANWNANITADDNSKWYTIKIEWCGAANNTYMCYRVYDRETGELMGKYEGNYGKWTDGNAGAAVTPKEMQAPMFWNNAMNVCQLDNIVFSKLPVGYEHTTYHPQVWVNDAIASSVDAINAGDKIECQSYGPVGATQLLVGYNAAGEIIATKVMNDVIRDRYRTTFNAAAEDFAGAATIRLFFFEDFGGTGFKPITTATTYSIVE